MCEPQEKLDHLNSNQEFFSLNCWDIYLHLRVGAVPKTQLSWWPADLSHQSASYCTYCSHSHSSDPVEWVRMQLGDDVWGKQQRPVMSLCVRAVISSRCKCILVQVGPLIYSSKGIFINLSLISLSTRCTHWCESGDWRRLIPLVPSVIEVFPHSRRKHGRGGDFFFHFKCETEKQGSSCKAV